MMLGTSFVLLGVYELKVLVLSGAFFDNPVKHKHKDQCTQFSLLPLKAAAAAAAAQVKIYYLMLFHVKKQKNKKCNYKGWWG